MWPAVWSEVRWAFTPPRSWLLGVHWGWGLAGVWMAYAADEWIRGLLMWRRWLTQGWVPHARKTHARIKAQTPAGY